MAKRTLDQQLLDLQMRQRVEKSRVALRATIADLKSAAHARNYGDVITFAKTCEGLARALGGTELEEQAGTGARRAVPASEGAS